MTDTLYTALSRIIHTGLGRLPIMILESQYAIENNYSLFQNLQILSCSVDVYRKFQYNNIRGSTVHIHLIVLYSCCLCCLI